MDYFFLDLVPWEDSQALYHAAAYLGREALFILRPATPYICVGYHQDAQQEVELDFARRMSLPVLRREVGGGAVYLDRDQLFYQLILSKDRPGLSRDKIQFYRNFLRPVVETYREFGVPAEFKPVNDILANGRKVSGNGAAEIEEMIVLVGNFILDFNCAMMSRVLRVPDEKFRDKLYKTLGENMSSMKREIGAVPATADLANALTRRLEPLLGSLTPRADIDAALRAMASERFAVMHTSEWLLANDRRRQEIERVKVREGVYVVQKLAKLPGGLLRVTALSQEGRLSGVQFSGDFFCYPRNALVELERALEDAPIERAGITQAIETFYQRHEVETPGITPEDLAGILTS